MSPTESIVGSVASQGGALATLLPILGLFFIWYKKRGDFNKYDWIFIIGLIFIGFVSFKRAVWFIFPVLLALLIFYVPKRRIPQGVAFISIIAVPVIFFLGVKLNPSLNREYKIWGSFDFDYAVNYARNYSFGDEEKKDSGRGGATMMLVNNFINGDLKKADWLGYGLRTMYATDYVEFAELGFGISGKGAATGVYQTMVSNGFVGIITTIWVALSILLFTKNSRLRIVLIGFFLWEYFFYTGMVLRDPALSFLLTYVVLFSPGKFSSPVKLIQTAVN